MAFDLASVLKNVSDSDTGREQIQYIPLSQIDEDPNNFYQLEGIAQLADNISLCGLQQPIRVRQKEDGRYIIVSGHRRRAALEMLVADGYEKWQEAPCIVEQDAVSPALQQLRLIYANANTRKMTSAEISEQAQQVEKLLYQLKEEGYDFPGRMRDHVAEAVSVSKSKLARLKVIRENLAACWTDAWKNGTIGESVAYNLSQMPKSWQTVIHNTWGERPERLTADTVILIRDRFDNVVKIKCTHGLNICEHTVTMMEKCAIGNNGGCYHCCCDCADLQTCKSVCPQAAAKQKEMKAVAKKAQLDAKLEQEERDRPGAEFARMVWNRIGKARERSGVSIKDIVFARGESFYNEFCDDPKQKKMESGEGDYSPNSTVCFGYNLRACDVMHIVAVADALHCSIDYLLGRTEQMELVSELGTAWQTGEPTEIGFYAVVSLYDDSSKPDLHRMLWTGFGWKCGNYEYDPDTDGQILGWMPMPEVSEKPKPATNESCITGMSPSGHCGAAACCSDEYTCCLQCPDDSCNCRCGWIDDVAEVI